MEPGLPPLSLDVSSGPAISGAPNESGNVATGDFIVNKAEQQKTGLMAVAAVALPLITFGGIVWLLMRKK